MNARTGYLLVVILAFLGGAFVSVLDPLAVNWSWLGPILAVGVFGLWGYRRAVHGEASSGHRLAGNMQLLAGSLANINANLRDLCARKEALPVYEARFEIDRLFRADLDSFAEARETMIHVMGMRNYADVMSAFAAGERYINRVWSASTDGYQDEVRTYLERAREQLGEAEALFLERQQAALRAARQA